MKPNTSTGTPPTHTECVMEAKSTNGRRLRTGTTARTHAHQQRRTLEQQQREQSTANDETNDQRFLHRQPPQESCRIRGKEKEEERVSTPLMRNSHSNKQRTHMYFSRKEPTNTNRNTDTRYSSVQRRQTTDRPSHMFTRTKPNQ